MRRLIVLVTVAGMRLLRRVAVGAPGLPNHQPFSLSQIYLGDSHFG
jgi:hypothetical protein